MALLVTAVAATALRPTRSPLPVELVRPSIRRNASYSFNENRQTQLTNHSVVSWCIGGGRRQIRNGLAFQHGLKVDVPRFALFLLPREADKRPLDVIVDYLLASAAPAFQPFHECGITFFVDKDT